MRIAILENKQSLDEWKKIEFSIHAEKILKEIEKSIQREMACLQPVEFTMDLAKKSLEWWTLHACLVSPGFYYRVESLGVDACGVMGDSMVSYYRVTLFGELGNKRVLKQSTVVLPIHAKEGESCSLKMHGVSEGRQMLRTILTPVSGSEPSLRF